MRSKNNFRDYLLIEQFLREYVCNVDWVHGGGCHNLSDRLFVQYSFVRRRKCDGEIAKSITESQKRIEERISCGDWENGARK